MLIYKNRFVINKNLIIIIILIINLNIKINKLNKSNYNFKI